MLTAGTNGFVDRLRRSLAADLRADAELVRGYAATGSEAAFAELVRRLAPVVWGVCRRLVPDRQLAEDAFQATFLVLVRKAGSIRPPSAVGGWLHTVAVHTSTRARAMADRRKTKMKPLGDHDPPGVALEPTDPEVLRALDEEIARLPDAQRAAVVLCELGGVSRNDAAKRLNIAEGTLSSRLAAARKTLATRLRARGVALAVALALVPAVEAAPGVTSTITETASTFADGAIRTMFLTKLRLTAVPLAVLAVSVVGSVGFAAPPDGDRYQIKAPIPKEKAKTEMIAVGVHEIREDSKPRIDLLTPKGEKVGTLPLDPHPMFHVTLSRDGKRVAVWAMDKYRFQGLKVIEDKQKTTGAFVVYDVDAPDKPLLRVKDAPECVVVFAPDGASLYVSEFGKPDPVAITVRTYSHAKLDLKTEKKEELKLPIDLRINDVSPDGKTLLAASYMPRVKGEAGAATFLVPVDTLKPKQVSEANVAGTRFSPDGSRVVGVKFSRDGFQHKQGVAILDVKDGKESAVDLGDDTFSVLNTVWSPDGKRLLIERSVQAGGQPQGLPNPGGGGGGGNPTREIAIRNLDGSDPKPLLELKKEVHVFGLDWR